MYIGRRLWLVTYTGRKSMVPVYKRDQVVTYTGRASRHLYRETTRPLSITEKFQVYPYTGRYLKSIPITAFFAIRHIYRREVRPLCRETDSSSIQRDNKTSFYDWRISNLRLYRGKRSYPYTGRHLRTLSMTSFFESRHVYRERGWLIYTGEDLRPHSMTSFFAVSHVYRDKHGRTYTGETTIPQSLTEVLRSVTYTGRRGQSYTQEDLQTPVFL